MLSYLLRRLAISLPILLGITVIIFYIASQMPGDAVMAMISQETPMAEDLMKLRRGQLGLDQPLPVQYLRWLGQLAQGNLGFSFQTGEPVGAILAARILATLQLMFTALLVAIFLGVLLGVGVYLARLMGDRAPQPSEPEATPYRAKKRSKAKS